MAILPQLHGEDIQTMDAALGDLISKSEAAAALVLDKGGFLIVQAGDSRRFDATTLGALAAAMYAATQGIAGLVGEANFSSVYQQGEKSSLLVNNIDENCLLVVIFDAHISVGAVKYYATTSIAAIARQLEAAAHRAPGEGLDLATLNMVDSGEFFARKAAEVEVAGGTDENDPTVKLQKIKKLMDAGLITQEDFEFKKRKILEDM